MSKVRVGHDVLFSAQLIGTNDIPEKFHFDFNHKWWAIDSNTKIIAVRKIKAYPMNLTAETGVAIGDANGTKRGIKIHYALIENQRITKILIYIVSEINKFIDHLYSNIFPWNVSNLWNDYNNRKSTITFTPFLLGQFNHAIIFQMRILRFLISDRTTYSSWL